MYCDEVELVFTTKLRFLMFTCPAMGRTEDGYLTTTTDDWEDNDEKIWLVVKRKEYFPFAYVHLSGNGPNGEWLSSTEKCRFERRLQMSERKTRGGAHADYG